MTKTFVEDISKVLGQRVDSPDQYAPNILVREARAGNRGYLNIEEDKLPFYGFDIWNGYECSALTDNKLPVAFSAKVIYPASSKYIVESKSMKLYWNSFNMTTMGKTAEEVLTAVKLTAKNDLSELLGTMVTIELFPLTLIDYKQSGYLKKNYTDYDILEEADGVENLKFTVFNETPDLLKVVSTDTTHEYKYTSSLLRSNCKITKQPDSGDIYISYISQKTVTPESLLAWIVSLRNECHFHEEICEAAYKRLYDILDAKALEVTCFYARRGGWDINPIRTLVGPNMNDFSPICEPKNNWEKMPRQ